MFSLGLKKAIPLEKELSTDDGTLNLSIPSIGLFEEVTVRGRELDRNGLTHLQYSSLPSDVSSNVVIVGHSIDYGRYIPPPFYYLSRVVKGDFIQLAYLEKEYRYEIFDIKVVDRREAEIENVVPGRSLITLYTCFPVINPVYRLVVIGELVSIQ